MIKQEMYNIVNSSLKGYYEIIVTYEEDNQSKQDVIFIKQKEKLLDNSEIIKLATEEFNKKHVQKRKHTAFFNFVKKHKAFTIGASIVLVIGIATGVTLGVVYSIKSNNSSDEFDKMKTAYKNYLIKTASLKNYGDLSADEIMNKIVIGSKKIDDTHTEPIYGSLEKKTISNVETYFIKDIDYEDGFNRDSWPAATHVSQALNLAITAEVRHDQKIKDIATKMTYYWVFNNYRNTNWWQNELGADNNLASLGLFVYDDLNDKGKVALRGRISEASFYYRPSLMTHTGANLFDYADITLKSSIISKNQTEFTTAVDRVEEEITDKNLEGFQTDGSFFQHGQQVQIGSYGKGVIRLGKVLRTMAESSRLFKTEKMKIIENYILRGLRSMTHRGYTNYSAVSREIARDNNLDAQSSYKDFNVYLELDAFTRKVELQKYLDDLTDRNSNFDGMIYFDKAKMIVVNVDGVYMSFKGTAPYLTNTECVNDENQLGLNMSYGTNTCVMDTGKEYYNIMPVWDFSYIPGTTSIQVTDENNSTIKDSKKGDGDYQVDLAIPGCTPEGEPVAHKGQDYSVVIRATNREKPKALVVMQGDKTIPFILKTDYADDACELTILGSNVGLYEGDIVIKEAEFEYNDKRIMWMRDVYGDQLYENQLPTPESEVVEPGDTPYGYVYSGTESIEKSVNDEVAVIMQRSCHHEENRFTVTCIATPEGMVILGADLGYDGSVTEKDDPDYFAPNTRKLHTTIDQAFSVEGETLVDNKTFTKGNVIYKSLDNHEIKVMENKINGGYWGRNRALTTDEAGGKIDYVKGETTTIYIDHEDNRSDAKYAYSIQSKQKADDNETFTVVKNFDDNKIQEVVLPSGKTIVVSYEDLANDYTTESGITIEKEKLQKGMYVIVNEA